jgi:hypothetical protein
MSVDTVWIIGRMESNLTVFEGLLHAVEGVQSRWRPSPGKWSLLEVVNHLADEEIEDFGKRLRLALEDPQREWPPIDPERAAVERGYNNRELDESLSRFIRARRESVAWLRGLQNPNWEVSHALPKGGVLRAGDLLHSWLVHDLIHIRQINRLHYEYFAAAGPGFSPAYAGDW